MTTNDPPMIVADEALGHVYPEVSMSYDERDLVLYALGVGAPQDALGDELRFVYERHPDFAAIPSFGVIPSLNLILKLDADGVRAPGLNYGLEQMLHGEQYLRLTRPLPTSATLTHRATVRDIYDKGKGAVVITETESFDEAGELLMTNVMTTFIRGAGGWGGDRGPKVTPIVPPERAPDHVVEERTAPDQALLYRLSGDWNPLHADPEVAQKFGFECPILHGLCSFGFAVRHVLTACAPGGDFSHFESVNVRFARVVFPGDTLVTEMWQEGREVIFQVKVKERDEICLSNAVLTLRDDA